MKIMEKEELSVGDIQGDLLERKALPIGRTKFMEWSDRIIDASLVEADRESLRFALAESLHHLQPTEAFKPDGYFVLRLRNAAVKDTAHHMFQEIKRAHEAKSKQVETDPQEVKAVDVLENQKV